MDLKMVFSDFLRTKLVLWVDFSLSFTLVISQFIQGNFQRKTSDWFFFIMFFKDILIILLLFFQDILIILLLFWLFWFNRGYSVNDRLYFSLTVIKRDYNANDGLKFILSLIRRDNSLNERLKLVKNARKENWKWTK